MPLIHVSAMNVLLTMVGSGLSTGNSLRPISRDELIAFVVAESVGGAGGERLAVEFFLIGVAAEVIFFFEKQEIFAAEEIRGGKSCGACADDHDFHFAAGGREIERVAVANFVANLEMLAVDLGSGARGSGRECADGAAMSVWSIGQPAATEPATTNLMKSRRELGGSCGCSCCCSCVAGCSRSSCGPAPRLRVRMRYQITMSATDTRKNERRDGVDLRRDAAAQAAPDFERQRVVSADEEKCDGDFVHREREDQQARGDEREFQIWQRDAPERLPRRRAQIERGFFLSAIDFLQAGEEFGGGDGNQRRAVTQKNGEQAERQVNEDHEH